MRASQLKKFSLFQGVNKTADGCSAEEINLPSLNAAIEAASAGEAGKGFAVVASEVKNLAKKTAESTKQVADEIEKMRTNASNAGNAITGMAEVIARVSATAQTTAQTVGEQSVSTSEIAKNVEGANMAANDVAKSIAAIALGMETVSQKLQSLSSVSLNTFNHAADTERSTEELAKTAVDLREMVGRFKI